jgi:hypothetical protein
MHLSENKIRGLFLGSSQRISDQNRSSENRRKNSSSAGLLLAGFPDTLILYRVDPRGSLCPCIVEPTLAKSNYQWHRHACVARSACLNRCMGERPRLLPISRPARRTHTHGACRCRPAASARASWSRER